MNTVLKIECARDALNPRAGLLYEQPGFVDEILVHKVVDDLYFLCVNALNQDKDFEHILSHNHFDCEVEFESAICAAAIQGPKALSVAARLAGADLAAIKYYWFVDDEFAECLRGLRHRIHG